MRHDLRTAIRSLKRRVGTSVLATGGLAVGMACAVWIGLYVYNAWSTDRFHEAADRIVRVTTAEVTGDTTASEAASEAENRRPDAFPALAPAAVETVPEVERALRVDRMPVNLLEVGGRSFYEDGFVYADSTFFALFDFELVRGNPETALARPYSIVLPQSTARRYFGDANPMGETVTLKTRGDRADWTFEVTGVMEDFPPNTHLEATVLASMTTFNAEFPDYLDSNWRVVGGHTYLRLRPGASRAAVQEKLQGLVDRHTQAVTERYGTRFDVGLQPLPHIHLYSDLPGDLTPGANPTSLVLLAVFGMLILVIAAVNVVNLATAQATRRRAEIGVRKALGARPVQVARQFLAQSTVQAAVALAGAAVVIGLGHGPFQRWLGVDLPLAAHGWVLAGLGAGVVAVVGLGAGSYPALVLSRFRPSAALRSDPSDWLSGATVRRGLLAVQVGIAVLLVAGTAVVLQQLHYVQTTDVGFDREDVTVVETRFRPADSSRAVRMKRAFERLPSVRHAALAGRVPTEPNPLRRTVRAEGWPAGQNVAVNLHEIDSDYLATLGVALTAGRNLADSVAADTAALLANRTAAKRLRGEAGSAVGTRVYADDGSLMGRVVGVVGDVHHASLRHAVEPALYTTEWIRDRRVILEMAGAAGAQAGAGGAGMEPVRAVWSRFYPDRPLDAFSLDRAYEAQYRSEQRLSRIIGLFAGVALALACLGLYTLTAYAAERRTKEIGIRKAVGASAGDVVRLLTRDYAGLVAVAFAGAAPLAHLAMRLWLDDFAYHVDLRLGVFLLAGLATAAVALTTAALRAHHAARLDPARALRSE